MQQGTRRQRSPQETLVPLLMAAVGIGAVLAVYFLAIGFQPLELVLIIVAIVFGALGYPQNILRGIMTAAFAYVATGVAATYYMHLAPYIGAPFGDQVTPTIRVLSFILLTAVVWAALETVGRLTIRDTSLPALSFVDNIGGLLIYLAIGILVASLLFNAAGRVPNWRRMHDAARLRPVFNYVIALLYRSQSFWFGEHAPAIYVYDLPHAR